MYSKCGLCIDGETLIDIDNVLTFGISTEVSNKAFSNVCGGLCYDTDMFKIVDGVLTVKDDEKETITDYVISSCYAKFDAEYFSIENGQLVLEDTALKAKITFDITPDNVIITVLDSNGETVQPTSDSKVYRLNNDETYSYTIYGAEEFLNNNNGIQESHLSKPHKFISWATLESNPILTLYSEVGVLNNMPHLKGYVYMYNYNTDTNSWTFSSQSEGMVENPSNVVKWETDQDIAVNDSVVFRRPRIEDSITVSGKETITATLQ